MLNENIGDRALQPETPDCMALGKWIYLSVPCPYQEATFSGGCVDCSGWCTHTAWWRAHDGDGHVVSTHLTPARLCWPILSGFWQVSHPQDLCQPGWPGTAS